jgi:DNA polymerase-4
LRWICPKAAVLRYSLEIYQFLYEELWDTVYRFSPVIEPVAFHAGFFDATGCFGDMKLEEWRQALMEAVAEAIGLSPQVGIGPTRGIAQIAGKAGRCVGPNVAEEFLAEAPVEWLPVNEAVVEFLQCLGIKRVGEVRWVPMEVLTARLGQENAWIVKAIADGKDARHVVSSYPPPRISRRIAGPIEADGWQIRELLGKACSELFVAFEQRRLAPASLRLTLEFADAPPCRREHRFLRPADSASAIAQAAWRLWLEMWHGEELLAAEIMLCGLQPNAPRQLDLLGNARVLQERQIRLERVMAHLKARFGDKAIVKARELPERMRFAEKVLAMQVSGHA